MINYEEIKENVDDFIKYIISLLGKIPIQTNHCETVYLNGEKYKLFFNRFYDQAPYIHHKADLYIQRIPNKFNKIEKEENFPISILSLSIEDLINLKTDIEDFVKTVNINIATLLDIKDYEE